MTQKNFILWLDGFLDGISQIENHHLAKIKEKLKSVDFSEPEKFDPDWFKYRDPIPCTEPDMVPYGDLCSCNPKNGGSGICGCIMGNKLVPNPKKYPNIGTITVTGDSVIFTTGSNGTTTTTWTWHKHNQFPGAQITYTSGHGDINTKQILKG